MSILSLKPDPVVGLDISTTAVKLLELSRAGKKGYKVESYAIEPLPEKALEDKNIAELEVVGETIERVIKRASPRAQHAAIAVAGPTVITKDITMDAGMPDHEMKDAIEAEPAQYLGQDIEVYFDFQVIGPNEKEPAERVDVLLAAVHNETLDPRVAAVEMGGLKTRIVDIEKFALENALIMVAQNDPEIGEGETVALIEVGATTTTMNVLGEEKGEPKIVYTREEMFGGRQLTEQIQGRYDLSYEEANLAKRNDTLPEDYKTDLLEPFKEEVAMQVNRMIQYYYSSSTYGKLSHILIAGGCASIPDILEPISTNVGGPVSIVNPFASMTIASRVSKKALMNDAPALMIACGLALRTFDEY